MTEHDYDVVTEPTQPEAAGHGPADGGLPVLTDQETEDLLEAMRDVVDPELGVNVVDLGLVYGVTMETDRTATIDMTLTSAACPLTDVIEDQTRVALEAWCRTSGSTGSGCRRGVRRRSPRTGESSCARSASTSDPSGLLVGPGLTRPGTVAACGGEAG